MSFHAEFIALLREYDMPSLGIVFIRKTVKYEFLRSRAANFPVTVMLIETAAQKSDFDGIGLPVLARLFVRFVVRKSESAKGRPVIFRYAEDKPQAVFRKLIFFHNSSLPTALPFDRACRYLILP